MWKSGAFSDIVWLGNIYFCGHSCAGSWKKLVPAGFGELHDFAPTKTNLFLARKFSWYFFSYKKQS